MWPIVRFGYLALHGEGTWTLHVGISRANNTVSYDRGTHSVKVISLNPGTEQFSNISPPSSTKARAFLRRKDGFEFDLESEKWGFGVFCDVLPGVDLINLLRRVSS